ncbi:J domain-containing protein [Enterococcus faecalis]|uniref:J domain-containing protein n=1 Tax=Enterococcus faecalis TaxID=1351 RepID=UPI003F2720CB
MSTINNFSEFLLNSFLTLVMIGFIISVIVYLCKIAWNILLPLLEFALLPIQLFWIILKWIGTCISYILIFIILGFQKTTKTKQQKQNNTYSNGFFGGQRQHYQKQNNKNNYSYSDSTYDKKKQNNQQKTTQNRQQQSYQNYSYSSNYTYDNLETYRKILGVKQGDSKEEIKKQYRTLVKKYHPDKNSDPEANTKFKEIVTAYEKLVS